MLTLFNISQEVVQEKTMNFDPQTIFSYIILAVTLILIHLLIPRPLLEKVFQWILPVNILPYSNRHNPPPPPPPAATVNDLKTKEEKEQETAEKQHLVTVA